MSKEAAHVPGMTVTSPEPDDRPLMFEGFRTLAEMQAAPRVTGYNGTKKDENGNDD